MKKNVRIYFSTLHTSEDLTLSKGCKSGTELFLLVGKCKQMFLLNEPEGIVRDWIVDPTLVLKPCHDGRILGNYQNCTIFPILTTLLLPKWKFSFYGHSKALGLQIVKLFFFLFGVVYYLCNPISSLATPVLEFI